jgi:hypothetical protein
MHVNDLKPFANDWVVSPAEPEQVEVRKWPPGGRLGGAKACIVAATAD